MQTHELIGKIRHLVSLDEPENGGPYQGLAAKECMDSMQAAADRLSEQKHVIDELERFIRYAASAIRQTGLPEGAAEMEKKLEEILALSNRT